MNTVVEQNKIFNGVVRRYPLPLIPKLSVDDIGVLIGIYIDSVIKLSNNMEVKLPTDDIEILSDYYTRNEEAYLKALEIVVMISHNQSKLDVKDLINYPDAESDFNTEHYAIIDKTHILHQGTKINRLLYELKSKINSGSIDDLVMMLSKFIYLHNTIRSTIFSLIPSDRTATFKPTTTHAVGNVLTELNWLNNSSVDISAIENEELAAYHKDCLAVLKEGFKTNVDEDGYITIETLENDDAIAESLLTIVDTDIRSHKCLAEDDTLNYKYAVTEHSTQLMYLLATVNKEIGCDYYDLSPLPLTPSKYLITDGCVKIHDIVSYPEENAIEIGNVVKKTLEEFSNWARQMGTGEHMPNYYLLKDRISALIMLYAAHRDDVDEEE